MQVDRYGLDIKHILLKGTAVVCCVFLSLNACAPVLDAPDSTPTASVPTIAPTMAMHIEPDQLQAPSSQAEVVSADAVPDEAPAPQGIDYTVQPGDTLFELAMAYGIPMAAIQLQNDLGANTVLHAGQVLYVPAESDWEGASPFWVLYEVGEGETLSGIAKAYGVTTAALQSVNGLTDADWLTVGQYLILPLDSPAEVALVANAPPPTATPEPTATPLPSPTIVPSPTQVPVPSATPGAMTAPPADLAALPMEVFRLLNAERAAHDLPPLVYNATLAHAAQLHANDCYERGWCGHTGSDGSTMKERIIRAGYDPARWSECWAWYRSAEGAVAAWMDEVPPDDPHRRTILSTYLTEVGIGVVPGNGHGYYFIADFGTPKTP